MARREPLWLWVHARDYPLRAQFSWHRHLLRRGRVVFGLVIDFDPWLAHPPRTEEAHDGFAVTLLAPETPAATAPALLERVAAQLRATDGSRDVAETLSEDAHTVQQHLDEMWPFPMLVEVPRELTDGHLVYCTSVLVVLRHTPLGQLCSPWVPLLIDPGRSCYTMILPMRYWPTSWRRDWKHKPATEAAQSTNPTLDSRTP